MSEQNNAPSITSGVREKDPRRVAAGKRLGAISKQQREAKRLERAQQDTIMETQEEVGNGYTPYLVGGVIAVGALSYLFQKKV